MLLVRRKHAIISAAEFVPNLHKEHSRNNF